MLVRGKNYSFIFMALFGSTLAACAPARRVAQGGGVARSIGPAEYVRGAPEAGGYRDRAGGAKAEAVAGGGAKKGGWSAFQVVFWNPPSASSQGRLDHRTCKF